MAAVSRPSPVSAQVPQMPPPAPSGVDRPFTLSVGPGLTKSLTYAGDWTTTLTVALGWSPDEHWTFVVAPYWERESDLIEGTKVSYNELSISAGASYSFAPGWTVGMDLDFGIVHDFFGPWQGNPEFGVGVGISYAFPLGGRWNLVVGPEVSWKISDEEFQVGLNTGVSFDF
jgi:outer membrane receptor protein involved in Fe transport